MLKKNENETDEQFIERALVITENESVELEEPEFGIMQTYFDAKRSSAAGK